MNLEKIKILTHKIYKAAQYVEYLSLSMVLFP